MTFPDTEETLPKIEHLDWLRSTFIRGGESKIHDLLVKTQITVSFLFVLFSVISWIA